MTVGEVIILAAVLVLGLLNGLFLLSMHGKLHAVQSTADQNNTEILQVNTMLGNFRNHEHEIHELTRTWWTRSEYETHLLLRTLGRLLSGNLQMDGDENHLELKIEIGEALKPESHV